MPGSRRAPAEMSVSKTSGEQYSVADRVESQGRAQQKANDRGPRQKMEGAGLCTAGEEHADDGSRRDVPVCGNRRTGDAVQEV